MSLRILVVGSALFLVLAACGEGEGAAAGPAPVVCAASDVLCGRSCVDVEADPRHCGGCDQACPAGALCVDGACATCPAGQLACDGACFDPSSSVEHCGSCGSACGDGFVCSAGACVVACPGTQSACDGGCHSLETSNDHCGACGNACGAGELCSDGTCQPVACPDGHALCDGACTPVGTDADNCGACGNVCGRGELCVDGGCELACGAEQTVCDGACRDLARDSRHCGACGTPCAAGEACVDGACAIDCAPFADEICDGACTNTDIDPANCGACGTVCPVGELCAAGACVEACPDEATACAGSCTDLDDDPANCGACGNVCPPVPNGVPICTGGICGGICSARFEDCNGDLAAAGGDGCETDLFAGIDNCGGCGQTCTPPPGAASVCMGGFCSFECAPDRGDCNGDPADGCETYLDTPTDCGFCGFACTGASYCDAGTCVLPGPGADCANAISITSGTNSISWTSTRQTYLTASPACVTGSSAPIGGDIVLRYDPTTSGEAHLEFTVPGGASWNVVVARGTCGAIDTPLACATLTIPFIGSPVTGIRFNVIAGESYYLHLVATSSELADPLQIAVTETAIGCAPGTGGMVGDTQSRLFTGIFGMYYEQYVAVDEAPGGYVYFGGSGTAGLYRMPKAGGRAEDIGAALGASFTPGYEMLIDGSNIYALAQGTGTSGLLRRISADGGTTWSVEDAATFPSAPTAEIRGAAAYGGRIYLITFEGYGNAGTQIWSVGGGSTTLPGAAVLEHTFGAGTYANCAAVAVDAQNFYAFCGSGPMGASSTVVRIDRTSGVITELVTSPPSSSFGQPRQNLALHADDRNADGQTDFLYFLDDSPNAGVICDPAGASPSATRPYFFGTGTGNHGLGFDRTTNALWGFHDDTNELVKFE